MTPWRPCLFEFVLPFMFPEHPTCWGGCLRSLWCSWAENKIRSNILKLEQRWGVAVLRPTAIAKWGVHPASTSPMEMVGKNKKKLRKHRVKSVATPKHELKNWQFMAKTRKPCNKHQQTRAKSPYPTCAMNFIVCSPTHHRNTDTKENMEKHRGRHRFCRYKSDFRTQNYKSGVSQEKKHYKKMSQLEKMFLQKSEGFTA